MRSFGATRAHKSLTYDSKVGYDAGNEILKVQDNEKK